MSSIFTWVIDKVNRGIKWGDTDNNPGMLLSSLLSWLAEWDGYYFKGRETYHILYPVLL